MTAATVKFDMQHCLVWTIVVPWSGSTCDGGVVTKASQTLRFTNISEFVTLFLILWVQPYGFSIVWMI
jgi:hypothetical protein